MKYHVKYSNLSSFKALKIPLLAIQIDFYKPYEAACMYYMLIAYKNDAQEHYKRWKHFMFPYIYFFECHTLIQLISESLCL